jgi:hypothetical protein
MVKASEVKAKLDTHEAVCSERWKETILRKLDIRYKYMALESTYSIS